jgi:hypothetical protein
MHHFFRILSTLIIDEAKKNEYLVIILSMKP